MLVVYKIVLLAHRSLGTFFEFILTVAGTTIGGQDTRSARECDLHAHKLVIPQDSHQLVQLFGLQPHSSGQIVILETAILNVSHEVVKTNESDIQQK